jgi:hypothetical protein
MMQGKTFMLGALALGLLASAGFAIQSARAGAVNARGAAAAQCDRACLDAIMDQYIAALLKHDPSGLPVADNLKSTENTKSTPLGQGVWQTIKFMKFRGETVADPSTGEVTYWGAIQENFVSLLMVRLKVENGKITEVETIVPHGSGPKAVRDGFEVMPDLQLLAAIKPFLESEIPVAERASRAELIAAANAYFDGIEHQPGHVPFAPGCNRIENGQLTTNNPTNSEGLPPLGCQDQFQAKLFTYIPHVASRRFLIVDESHGLVVAMVVFDIPGSKTWIRDGKEVPAPPAVANPRNNILNEMFKVEHGQIQLIQAFMLPNEPYGTQTGWSEPKP